MRIMVDGHIGRCDQKMMAFLGIDHGLCEYRYDFNEPEVVPPSLAGQCDVILLDPPYLVSYLFDS